MLYLTAILPLALGQVASPALPEVGCPSDVHHAVSVVPHARECELKRNGALLRCVQVQSPPWRKPPRRQKDGINPTYTLQVADRTPILKNPRTTVGDENTCGNSLPRMAWETIGQRVDAAQIEYRRGLRSARHAKILAYHGQGIVHATRSDPPLQLRQLELQAQGIGRRRSACGKRHCTPRGGARFNGRRDAATGWNSGKPREGKYSVEMPIRPFTRDLPPSALRDLWPEIS